MLKSKLYKQHFPILSRYTEFTEKEKNKLCIWAGMFKKEVVYREWRKINSAHKVEFCSYFMKSYNLEKMTEMINKNHFDEENLFWLNAILYRNKYNFVMSLWLFPVLQPQFVKILEDKLKNYTLHEYIKICIPSDNLRKMKKKGENL